MTRLIIQNEEARQNALRHLRLVDTAPSEAFDRITRMASRLMGAPVSTISLTDNDRQWFKSKVGADLVQIPRSEAPCHYAIQKDEIFVVPDLALDDRFKDTQLGKAGIRFYAGAPLVTRSGYGLGTLCVLDDKPREISEDERRLLVDLAAMVMTQIEIQNAIGLIDPSSGHPNQYQLFEDLEDARLNDPDVESIGLLIELVSSEQVGHGTRVLGAAYAEELVRHASAVVRRSVGDDARLYQVSPIRCVVILNGQWAGRLDELTAGLDQGLRQTISCAGIPVTPNPAIGVYRFHMRGVSPRDALRRLFNAAADARRTGQTSASYSEADDQAYARSFTLLNDMLTAPDQPGALVLLFQPVVDFVTGQCTGAEALLRWRHPTLGTIMPGEFIPLAEETAFIQPLTDWVLNAAIAQIAAWRTTRTVPKLSINASARNLEEGDFAQRIARILAKHNVEPQAIQLEFIESALVSDGVRTTGQLAALRDLGVSIVIDDFGTGYSSLSYLQQIPADVLKIDQAFVRALATSEHDRKLARAIILMAHDLGYRVVAEGVGDQAAFDLLASWGCDEAQGFHISQPLPADAVAEWFAPSGGLRP
jgi:EAL domain-containing protein (putative c-di-GMP-specific phosphodiesterase class I)